MFDSANLESDFQYHLLLKPDILYLTLFSLQTWFSGLIPILTKFFAVLNISLLETCTLFLRVMWPVVAHNAKANPFGLVTRDNFSRTAKKMWKIYKQTRINLAWCMRNRARFFGFRIIFYRSFFRTALLYEWLSRSYFVSTCIRTIRWMKSAKKLICIPWYRKITPY